MNTRDLKAPGASIMPDVQGSVDVRQQPIQQVGVKGLRYPMRWLTADGSEQPGVGTFGMYVALPATQKGTHMSRFIELLEQAIRVDAPAFDLQVIRALHRDMLVRLEAERGRLEIAFTLFIRKTAPVSGVQSLLDYEVHIVAEGADQDALLTLTVVVPVKSLCPCSKGISDYGAHNQRSHVTMSIRSQEPVSVEQIIRVAEEEASCEIFGLLKRVRSRISRQRA